MNAPKADQGINIKKKQKGRKVSMERRLLSETFLVPDISTLSSFSTLPDNQTLWRGKASEENSAPGTASRSQTGMPEGLPPVHLVLLSLPRHLYLCPCLCQYLYLHLVVFSLLTTIRCILPAFSFSLYRIIVLPYWTPTWCHKRHFTAHLWIEMCVGCQIHKEAPWSVRELRGANLGR